MMSGSKLNSLDVFIGHDRKIEAINREIQKHHPDDKQRKQTGFSQHFAMSIGEHNNANSAGNFDHPITAYMLADFADEFKISLPRIQLLMDKMISAVLDALDTAKEKALEQQLSKAERNHIDLCIAIIKAAATELSNEVEQIPQMSALL